MSSLPHWEQLEVRSVYVYIQRQAKGVIEKVEHYLIGSLHEVIKNSKLSGTKDPKNTVKSNERSKPLEQMDPVGLTLFKGRQIPRQLTVAHSMTVLGLPFVKHIDKLKQRSQLAMLHYCECGRFTTFNMATLDIRFINGSGNEQPGNQVDTLQGSNSVWPWVCSNRSHSIYQWRECLDYGLLFWDTARLAGLRLFVNWILLVQGIDSIHPWYSERSVQEYFQDASVEMEDLRRLGLEEFPVEDAEQLFSFIEY